MDLTGSSRGQVEQCLRRFLDATGRKDSPFDDETNLIGDLGLSSDEGLDLVLDLCDEFDFDFPKDFNPAVHENGRRGRRFGELVASIERLLPRKEPAQ